MVPVPQPSAVPVNVSTPLNVNAPGVLVGTRQKSYTDRPCQVSPGLTPKSASPWMARTFGQGIELGTALPSSWKWVKTGTGCPPPLALAGGAGHSRTADAVAARPARIFALLRIIVVLLDW